MMKKLNTDEEIKEKGKQADNRVRKWKCAYV